MKKSVNEAWRVLRMPCREYAALVSRELDGPLPLLSLAALRTHLLVCRSCRNFARQIRFLHTAVRRLPERGPASDEGMPEEVRGRLRARMNEIQP
jgi:predicted anti-sigma-YlaC factor YlaD